MRSRRRVVRQFNPRNDHLENITMVSTVNPGISAAAPPPVGERGFPSDRETASNITPQPNQPRRRAHIPSLGA
jgi:hypothetical protein